MNTRLVLLAALSIASRFSTTSVASAAASSNALASATPEQPAVASSASAGAGYAGPRTGRPSPEAWCRAPKRFVVAKDLREDGSASGSCAYIEVSEWIMVGCKGMATDLGTYTRAVPGGGSAASVDELAAVAQEEWSDAIVISLRPGTEAAPTFFYTPIGHPEWKRDRSLKFSLAKTATAYEQRSVPSTVDSGEQSQRSTDPCDLLAKPKVEIPAVPVDVDDVANQPPVPDAAAWDPAKEVFFPGTDALGCKSKLVDSWFRVVCDGKIAIAKATAAKGKRKTQTTVTIEDGKLTLLTPYVETTDMLVQLETAGGGKLLKLRWAKGKQPYPIGTIEAL